MSENICPICGEPMAGSSCFSCGYVLPDFDKLSAPFDFDPSNVLFGAAAEESDSPASGMETIESGGGMPSLNLPESGFSANLGANLAAGKAVNPNKGAALRTAQTGAVPNIKVRPNITPPAAQQAAAPQAAQNPVNNPVPVNNPNTYSGQYNPNILTPASVGTNVVKDVADFAANHWWQFLLMLIMPMLGTLIGVFYIGMGRLEKKFEKSILGITFLFLSVLLMSKGVDVFGMEEYIWRLLG